MKYLLGNKEITRKELETLVLKEVLELGKEKSPTIAYRGTYPVEYNVKNHACQIARNLGWDIKYILCRAE